MRRQSAPPASRTAAGIPAAVDFLSEAVRSLAALEAQGLRRRLITVEAVRGAAVRVQGRWLVNWCSNDYLGLSQHPALLEAAARAARRWGVGARASRLLSGSTTVHQRLEEALAQWQRAAEALVFPSGYQANLAVLGALLQPTDTVWADRHIHASLFEAIRATRATLRVFRHNDAGHLRGLLARDRKPGRCLIVTEGVFSMEGDFAPLQDLLDLAARHGGLLYVDDAHGAFVRGAQGRGSLEAAGITQGPFLYMATLGKALGAQGGFVAGPAPLLDWLRNRARPFIYTTAPAVPVVAAALAAVQLLAREPQHRLRLWQRARQLHAALQHRGQRLREPSHIVPWLVGAPEAALRLAARLRRRGHFSPAIRPPTVPAGTSRLRLSVTARHSLKQIEDLGRALP